MEKKRAGIFPQVSGNPGGKWDDTINKLILTGFGSGRIFTLNSSAQFLPPSDTKRGVV